jgi:pimeloyl-ACP methyl ester carboxylesterase
MRFLLLFVLLAVAFLAGCASLRSFDDLRREITQERFLQIGDQLVHVEQTGSGEPVVLLHGFGGSVYSWRKIVPALAQSHRVVAIDLNGFGYTQRPSHPESYTRAGQGRLVLAVMNSLGIERAHVVGHSYGGGLVLYLAFCHPERFRTLVLVDSSAPTYSDDRRSRAASLRWLSGLYVRTIALRPGTVRRSLLRSYYDDSQVTPELVQAYFDRLRIQGVAEAYYGLTAPSRTPGERVDLTKIDVPTLVVWGAQDEVVSLATGRRATAKIPRSELVVIAECGHLPMEEKPEELLRAVLPFLDRHRS